MLHRNDIVQVNLTNDELKIAYDFAKAAELGGVSRVRGFQERIDNLKLDQFIGVGIGELAGNKYFFTVNDYTTSRTEKNKNPHSGDLGSDTPGFRIDYKTSRAKKAALLEYNLAVRPHERHPENIYVLILVWTYGRSPEEMVASHPKPIVYLIGWAKDSDLPRDSEQDGIFGPINNQGGAFLIPAIHLRPIKDLHPDMIARC